MFIESLKIAAEHVRTTNGAIAFGDTNSKVLNLFSIGGAARTLDDTQVERLVREAHKEDPVLTFKCLFYIRDIRGGQGEREFFRKAIRALMPVMTLEEGLMVMENIPEYGRWDDFFGVIPTEKFCCLMENQLTVDAMAKSNGESISLLAKWLPSINAGKEAKEQAKELCKAWKMPHREYRKMLAELRTYIDVVEKKMCTREWSAIEYSKVPSQASRIYRKAFTKHDETRYSEFLTKVESGEVEIKAKTLYPYEILQSYATNSLYHSYATWARATLDRTLEAQWKALPDYCNGCTDNSLVICDTSGSMSGQPINIALSLAIYMAERNRGAFKDYFMTFSSRPQMVKLKGESLIEKLQNIVQINENTNLVAAFTMLLAFAVANHAVQEDMPKTLYIISDMQFDSCTDSNGFQSTFEVLKQKFKEHGYDLPRIVFWNVNSGGGIQFPVMRGEINTVLVSGASAETFKQVTSGEFTTPYTYMLSVLNSERYARIK